MAASSSTRGAMTTPSSSSVVESAGIEPGHAPADVGVVGAGGGEAEQLAVVEGGRHDGDVGQVGAAGVGIVEDPRDARGVVAVAHGGDRGGHRAEVHRYVLGLHDHLAGGVEERRRAVAALLDVGAVGRAHQHGAHLLARGAQRAGRDLQGDGIDAHARSSTSVPVSSVVPLQPSGTTSVASGSATTVGPVTRSPAGAPKSTARRRQAPGDAHGDELDLAVGVAMPVALLVQRLEALAQLVALRRRARSARATGRGSARPRRPEFGPAHPRRPAPREPRRPARRHSRRRRRGPCAGHRRGGPRRPARAR